MSSDDEKEDVDPSTLTHIVIPLGQSQAEKAGKCAECVQNRAIVYCIQCGVDLCRNCDDQVVHLAKKHKLHQRVPISQRDSVRRKGGLYVERKKRKKRLYGNQIQARKSRELGRKSRYCVECNVPCGENDPEHENHTTIPVAEVGAFLQEAARKHKEAQEQLRAQREEFERKLRQAEEAGDAEASAAMRHALEEAAAAEKEDQERLRQQEQAMKQAQLEMEQAQAQLAEEEAAREQALAEFKSKLAASDLDAEEQERELEEYMEKMEQERALEEEKAEEMERQLQAKLQAQEAKHAELDEQLEETKRQSEQAEEEAGPAQKRERSASDAEELAAETQQLNRLITKETKLITASRADFQKRLKQQCAQRSEALSKYSTKLASSSLDPLVQYKKLSDYTKALRTNGYKRDLQLREYEYKRVGYSGKALSGVMAKENEETAEIETNILSYEADLPASLSSEQKLALTLEYELTLRTESNEQVVQTAQYERKLKAFVSDTSGTYICMDCEEVTTTEGGRHEECDVNALPDKDRSTEIQTQVNNFRDKLVASTASRLEERLALEQKVSHDLERIQEHKRGKDAQVAERLQKDYTRRATDAHACIDCGLLVFDLANSAHADHENMKVTIRIKLKLKSEKKETEDNGEGEEEDNVSELSAPATKAPPKSPRRAASAAGFDMKVKSYVFKRVQALQKYSDQLDKSNAPPAKKLSALTAYAQKLAAAQNKAFQCDDAHQKAVAEYKATLPEDMDFVEKETKVGAFETELIVKNKVDAVNTAKWVRKKHPQTGKYFYAHSGLKKTQWEEPEEGWVDA